MPLLEVGWQDPTTLKGSPGALMENGPTTDVTVGWLTQNESENAPDFAPAKALIDTGATESCIDDNLALMLQLPIVDVITLSGIGGAEEHNVYAAEIRIPRLKFRQFGRFAGIHLSAGGQAHEVLLGRTLLQDMIMIYDGRRGHVTLAI